VGGQVVADQVHVEIGGRLGGELDQGRCHGGLMSCSQTCWKWRHGSPACCRAACSRSGTGSIGARCPALGAACLDAEVGLVLRGL
jgi:hypothetical protein